eukprot:TRINITY_DN23452_c0_g2_i2.p1 TRINITY_DN23452_c0_g2~~TRINITY_DN23452_c0_g2_i2.p1  ORF type:complete len:753 (-),score=88.64 TRINITY_DN23452_c0_g2_i2:28-2286(-)
MFFSWYHFVVCVHVWSAVNLLADRNKQCQDETSFGRFVSRHQLHSEIADDYAQLADEDKSGRPEDMKQQFLETLKTNFELLESGKIELAAAVDNVSRVIKLIEGESPSSDAGEGKSTGKGKGKPKLPPAKGKGKKNAGGDAQSDVSKGKDEGKPVAPGITSSAELSADINKGEGTHIDENAMPTTGNTKFDAQVKRFQQQVVDALDLLSPTIGFGKDAKLASHINKNGADHLSRLLELDRQAVFEAAEMIRKRREEEKKKAELVNPRAEFAAILQRGAGGARKREPSPGTRMYVPKCVKEVDEKHFSSSIPKLKRDWSNSNGIDGMFECFLDERLDCLNSTTKIESITLLIQVCEAVFPITQQLKEDQTLMQWMRGNETIRKTYDSVSDIASIGVRVDEAFVQRLRSIQKRIELGETVKVLETNSVSLQTFYKEHSGSIGFVLRFIDEQVIGEMAAISDTLQDALTKLRRDLKPNTMDEIQKRKKVTLKIVEHLKATRYSIPLEMHTPQVLIPFLYASTKLIKLESPIVDSRWKQYPRLVPMYMDLFMSYAGSQERERGRQTTSNRSPSTTTRPGSGAHVAVDTHCAKILKSTEVGLPRSVSAGAVYNQNEAAKTIKEANQYKKKVSDPEDNKLDDIIKRARKSEARFQAVSTQTLDVLGPIALHWLTKDPNTATPEKLFAQLLKFEMQNKDANIAGLETWEELALFDDVFIRYGVTRFCQVWNARKPLLNRFVADRNSIAESVIDPLEVAK